MVAFEDFMAEVRAEVDRTLDLLIPNADAEPRKLHEAIRWSIFAGGKRVRPAIAFATARTFGGDIATASRTAAALEMIHTYSLIHDDLPAMDDDDLRRGKATCHKQFGDATAILAGDVLQTLGYQAIAGDDGLSAEVRVRLISLIARASGTHLGMVSGQQLDLDAEGRERSLEEIEAIHSQKTGALIRASAVAGAVIAGAPEKDISAVARYADKLGLLFQITDDLLDVTQETKVLGKTSGKDAAAEKATYPGHYGIEQSLKMAADLLREAHGELASIDRDTTLLSELADRIARRTQ